MSPSRLRETNELIRQLRSKRQRRKRMRLMLGGLGAVVLVAAIIIVVVLTGGPSGGGASNSTVSTLVHASTTTATAATTTEAVVTTERVTSSSTTTTSKPTTTSNPATTSTTTWLSTQVVVVDPGHQAKADNGLEPIGPGATKKKAKVSGGTASPTTGTPESEVTLAVGLKLRDALEALGVKVVMTRTTQDVDVPNSERAKIANDAHADLAIRLHCNGGGPSAHGLFTLYPASIRGWTDDIAVASKKAAAIIQKAAIAATGAQDRGLQERSDLTGFNWSDVPDVLVEMGFMTNRSEDKLLESGAYQDKIVQGLVNGIVEFLEAQRKQ
jgi:N-acetylmuramoyl-L-alanine amidase